MKSHTIRTDIKDHIIDEMNIRSEIGIDTTNSVRITQTIAECYIECRLQIDSIFGIMYLKSMNGTVFETVKIQSIIVSRSKDPIITNTTKSILQSI